MQLKVNDSCRVPIVSIKDLPSKWCTDMTDAKHLKMEDKVRHIGTDVASTKFYA